MKYVLIWTIAFVLLFAFLAMFLRHVDYDLTQHPIYRFFLLNLGAA